MKRKPAARMIAKLFLAAVLFFFASELHAQEMEPRAYSASPIGLNFLMGAYSYSSGGVLFDPTLPITDVKARINTASLGYSRTFGLAGRAASLSAALPYARIDATGMVSEQPGRVSRSGMADARLRLAVNLAGNPAVTPQEFAQRRPATTLGTSLTVVAPIGEYDPAHLINIGSNRWSFKPEIGLAHPIGNWFTDIAAGVWLFTDNNDYYGGQRRSQDPVSTLQWHAGYTFRPGLWLAANGAYWKGGRTSVNGVDNNDSQSNTRYGATLSMPFATQYSLKLMWSRGAFTRIGGDFDTFGAAFQYRWFDR